jgi:hypothetical protein
MSKKKIASVECEIPGELSEYIEIDSKVSLLDYDIILFRPNIISLVDYNESFQGKPSLYDSSSFHLREHMEHWRREIFNAINSGKTVIFFLDELYEVFIDTGRRQYSGTGRNQRTTHIVELYNNYKCLPFDVHPINSKGSAMQLAKASEILSSYWAEFDEYSSYDVLIEAEVTKPLIVTRTGEKTVGAMIRVKDSPGTLLLLPTLDIGSEDLYEEKEDEWTDKGKQFGHRLLGAIIEIDKSLKQSSAITPIPEWANTPDYVLPREAKLTEELLKIDKELEKLQMHRQATREQLAKEGVLRRLLFEKGPPLEDAIIQALRLMGFSANKYKDSESEFDAVFESPEGRFLGEAEGRDKNAIGIDKLRQLEMNIHEDLCREEVLEPAKGVLFGNAYRLLPLDQRNEFFTEKCHKAAKRNNTILIITPDLFKVAKYLSGKADKNYSRACRKAILESPGKVVQFPEPPKITIGKIDIKEAKE